MYNVRMAPTEAEKARRKAEVDELVEELAPGGGKKRCCQFSGASRT